MVMLVVMLVFGLFDILLLMEQLFVSPSDEDDAEGGKERMHSMVFSLLNDVIGLSMLLTQ